MWFFWLNLNQKKKEKRQAVFPFSDSFDKIILKTVFIS